MNLTVDRFGESWAVFGPIYHTKTGIGRKLMARFEGPNAEKDARDWAEKNENVGLSTVTEGTTHGSQDQL